VEEYSRIHQNFTGFPKTPFYHPLPYHGANGSEENDCFDKNSGNVSAIDAMGANVIFLDANASRCSGISSPVTMDPMGSFSSNSPFETNVGSFQSDAEPKLRAKSWVFLVE
jgi:hypothetical protein